MLQIYLMNNQNQISQDQKIDFIYFYLKKEDRRSKYKFFFYIIVLIFIFWYILYFYFILVPSIKNSFNIFNLWSLTDKNQIEKSSAVWSLETQINELKDILNTKNIIY